MKVQITSGMYKGIVGHLSYDEDGTEWILINLYGLTRDVSTTDAQFTYC